MDIYYKFVKNYITINYKVSAVINESINGLL